MHRGSRPECCNTIPGEEQPGGNTQTLIASGEVVTRVSIHNIASVQH